MLKRSDLKETGSMHELYKENDKSLYLLVCHLSGDVEYKVFKNNNVCGSFQGAGMLNRAIAFFNGLSPLDYNETMEYEKYKELKKKYEKYDGII